MYVCMYVCIHVCIYKHLGSMPLVWRTSARAQHMCCRAVLRVWFWWVWVWVALCLEHRDSEGRVWLSRIEWQPWMCVRVMGPTKSPPGRSSSDSALPSKTMWSTMRWDSSPGSGWRWISKKCGGGKEGCVRDGNLWDHLRYGSMPGNCWMAKDECMFWRKLWITTMSLALLCFRLCTCTRPARFTRWTKVGLRRSLRGALKLGDSPVPLPEHGVPQATGSCLFCIFAMGILCALNGGAVYAVGLLVLQALQPMDGASLLHPVKCPCPGLSLDHVVCSLRMPAAWLSDLMVHWLVRAQAAFLRCTADMSEEGDVHSSDIEGGTTGGAATMEDPRRGTRIWELPRGPPPPVPVNETAERREQRESARRVAQAISFRVSGAVGHEIEVALTDIDEHLQRLPSRGLQHPWALWCGSDDGPEEEARTRADAREVTDEPVDEEIMTDLTVNPGEVMEATGPTACASTSSTSTTPVGEGVSKAAAKPKVARANRKSGPQGPLMVGRFVITVCMHYWIAFGAHAVLMSSPGAALSIVPETAGRKAAGTGKPRPVPVLQFAGPSGALLSPWTVIAKETTACLAWSFTTCLHLCTPIPTTWLARYSFSRPQCTRWGSGPSASFQNCYVQPEKPTRWTTGNRTIGPWTGKAGLGSPLLRRTAHGLLEVLLLSWLWSGGGMISCLKHWFWILGTWLALSP